MKKVLMAGLVLSIIIGNGAWYSKKAKAEINPYGSMLRTAGVQNLGYITANRIGQDVAAGQGIATIQKIDKADIFAVVGGNTMRYKTNTGNDHMDVHGWTSMVGYGNSKVTAKGCTLSQGVFIEYGKGTTSDSVENGISSDGDISYRGLGYMLKAVNKHGTYIEGTARYGVQEFESKNPYGSVNADSKYYGATIGVGHEWNSGKNGIISGYAKYMYNRTNGYTINEPLFALKDEISAVDSHRIRLGGRYEWNVKDKKDMAIMPYAGLAWEYEFSNRIENTTTMGTFGPIHSSGMNTKGSTGVLEVGCDYYCGKNLVLGTGAEVYCGKRRGANITVQANLTF